MKWAALLCALALPAHAGDTVLPGPVEILLPTVIEAEDYGLLFTLPDRFTDDELRTFVFDGDPLPVPVPLNGAHMFMATALVSLAALRLWRLT